MILNLFQVNYVIIREISNFRDTFCYFIELALCVFDVQNMKRCAEFDFPMHAK